MGSEQQRDQSPTLHSNTPTRFGVLGVDLCMPLWAGSAMRMRYLPGLATFQGVWKATWLNVSAPLRFLFEICLAAAVRYFIARSYKLTA